MKLLCFIGLLMVGISSASSQTFDEWFKQKKTQTQYLLQQVAALQVYIGCAQKGYQVVNKGLTTIGAIKDGHLRLDQAFFRAMDMVSPLVKGYDKIAAIISMELETVAQYRQTISLVTNSGQYTNEERHYVQTVFSGVISNCALLLSVLRSVTSDNVLQMSDDERLRRIDQLYTDMQDAYAFATQVKNQCGVLALQRIKEEQDARLLKKLYALPN